MSILVSYLFDEDDSFEALIIFDTESEDSLEFQRSLTFDDQDISMGMDKYCLVRAGKSHYGGVVDWSIVEGSLVLSLEDAAGETLELPDHTKIAVSPDDEHIIRQYLPQILR